MEEAEARKVAEERLQLVHDLVLKAPDGYQALLEAVAVMEPLIKLNIIGQQHVEDTLTRAAAGAGLAKQGVTSILAWAHQASLQTEMTRHGRDRSRRGHTPTRI